GDDSVARLPRRRVGRPPRYRGPERRVLPDVRDRDVRHHHPQRRHQLDRGRVLRDGRADRKPDGARGRPWGATIMVGGLTLALYSHAAFFLYSVVYLALEAMLYREWRSAVRVVR